MRQAITTKYIEASNYRSSRVKATAQAGSVTVSWDDGLDVDGNHTAAARALCDKYGWQGVLAGGGAPDGRGNVYVLLDRRSWVVALTGPTSLSNATRLADGILSNQKDLDGQL